MKVWVLFSLKKDWIFKKKGRKFIFCRQRRWTWLYWRHYSDHKFSGIPGTSSWNTRGCCTIELIQDNLRCHQIWFCLRLKLFTFSRTKHAVILTRSRRDCSSDGCGSGTPTSTTSFWTLLRHQAVVQCIITEKNAIGTIGIAFGSNFINTCGGRGGSRGGETTLLSGGVTDITDGAITPDTS